MVEAGDIAPPFRCKAGVERLESGTRQQKATEGWWRPRQMSMVKNDSGCSRSGVPFAGAKVERGDERVEGVKARGAGILETAIPMEGVIFKVRGDENNALAFGLEVAVEEDEGIVCLLKERVNVVNIDGELRERWDRVGGGNWDFNGDRRLGEGELLDGLSKSGLKLQLELVE
ncbi:hypothetical protein M407DRAFT_223121 [Tulasnella calospora MUT 4182]|uniref:Uncharacterized protein n=1 Tax=Tulasnella calospora MUT 4182 TaxID=1051891 RepID=A0A0C3Q7C2_9AGAM|nr:hypothetical protein M407DRAFT_223121 [Tulasnella calospora MUT 4182]